MIKKLGLFFIFIIIFFLINFIHMKSYYYNYLGDKYYMQDDLESASKYFLKANNNAGNYNLGNISYIKGNYDSAINYFSKISEFSSKTLLFRTNHNLGNAYYRIGEKDFDNELKHYKSSLDYYLKALSILFDEETKSNYDFVLDKIKELEENKNQEQNSDENQNSNENKDGNEKTSEENKDGNEKTSEENKDKNNNIETNSKEENSKNKESNSSENGDFENKDSTNPELTQEQTQAIEEYKEMLKKEQEMNSEGYNKIYEGENIDIFESFFNNSLLENDNKKDW